MFGQQPLAGDGTGMSFLPRIGHEVLVGFFDDDIERPYVMCSLHNGRGEGGEAVTPGGGDAQDVDASVFAQSSDAGLGAQGNLTGGNSAAWHGGSAAELDQGGQRNAAALAGYETKEFGGKGFNQLVFDDSTAQLRVQLATTQHATQLNLGHLIHQADNHRGSLRGVGFELRTDAYGAVRGGQGVLAVHVWRVGGRSGRRQRRRHRAGQAVEHACDSIQQRRPHAPDGAVVRRPWHRQGQSERARRQGLAHHGQPRAPIIRP
jgi:uncharacterized protein involved in type VI secretion and phage assembly